MNTRLIAIAVVLAAVAGAVALYVNRQSELSDAVIPGTEQVATVPVETRFCYLRESEGEFSTADGPDAEYLELNLDLESKHVSGIRNWIPSGKDSARGQLHGLYTETPDGKLFQGRYLYIIEGSEQGQEQYIRFDANSAQLAQGELVGDGSAILVYKDPASITYTTILPRVDCASVKPEYSMTPVIIQGES